MFDVGFYEILVIIVIGILLFSPKDFYEVIAKIAKLWKSLKNYMNRNLEDYVKIFDKEKISEDFIIDEKILLENKIENEFKKENLALFMDVPTKVKNNNKLKYLKNNNRSKFKCKCNKTMKNYISKAR